MANIKHRIPQQSVALLKSLLSSPSWAKTAQDVYLASLIITEKLPVLETSWIKPNDIIAQMNLTEQEEYLKKDKEWCMESIEFSLSPKEEVVVSLCIETIGHYLPVNIYSLELIKTFSEN